MQIKDKKAVVIGLGITGYYTALWAKAQGALVIVTDQKPETEFDSKMLYELREKGIFLELGGHNEDTIKRSDIIFPSPGVPLRDGPVNWAKTCGIPVIGELDIVSRFLKIPIIAITGTNGKSTVTTMVGELLKKAGIKSFVGGNLGIPAIKLLLEPVQYDYLVLEISSFQLDLSKEFSPHIAILLNITPDHLDRYDTFEEYVSSKISIFKNQNKNDFAILNKDDIVLSSSEIRTNSQKYWYSLRDGDGISAYMDKDYAIIRLNGREFSYSLKDYRLMGVHNVSNLLSVLLTGMILNVDSGTIQRCINDFVALPHRMELVRKLNGRIFIDDSKATNVDAVVKAVLSFNSPLILILGGRHKGSDYTPILEAGKENIKFSVLIGEAKELIAKCFHGKIEFSYADTLEEAVIEAYRRSDPGDVILLSPACSSFDMFKDYKHRGDEFKRIVKELKL